MTIKEKTVLGTGALLTCVFVLFIALTSCGERESPILDFVGEEAAWTQLTGYVPNHGLYRYVDHEVGVVLYFYKSRGGVSLWGVPLDSTKLRKKQQWNTRSCVTSLLSTFAFSSMR